MAAIPTSGTLLYHKTGEVKNFLLKRDRNGLCYYKPMPMTELDCLRYKLAENKTTFWTTASPDSKRIYPRDIF